MTAGNEVNKAQNALNKTIACMLSLTPLIGAVAPRGLAVLMIVTGIVGIIAFRIIEKRWPPVHKFILITATGLSFLVCISTLWAYDPVISMERGIKIISLMIGAWALISVIIENKQQIWPYVKIVLPLASLTAMIIMIINLYGNNILYALMHPGISPSQAHNLSEVNHHVTILISTAICSLYALRGRLNEQSKITINLRFLLIAAIIAILYKTDNQSVQLSVFIFAAAFWLLPYAWQEGWKIISVIIALLICTTPFLTEYVFHMVHQWTDMAWLQRGYAAGRLEIWNFVMHKALESPWIGHGVEATRAIGNFETKRLYYPFDTLLHPHNFSVQIWMEFGLLGAVLTSLWLVALIRIIWKTCRINAKRFQMAMLLSMLSIASTGYGLWQSWWVSLLIVLSAMTYIITTTDNQGKARKTPQK